MVSCWGALIKKPSPGTTTPRSQGTSKNSITESWHSSTSAGSNKSTASVSLDGVYPDGQILETPKLKIYSFAELKAATRNFRADAVLGEGCFGRVFKGWVDEKTYAPSKPGSGMAVAVKRWNPGSFQGLPEWKTEVNLLGKLSHPNLVKLIGSCSEDKELLLVYEFMQRGSLDNHLFRRGSACKPLSWSTRIKIALDAAHGLAFLHTLRKPIIYRDFKTSSILLDGKFNAKLSNSGLAKNAPENGDSYVSTRVMSTSGYGAPEYIASGHLYVKSDVYCFGVVLLEILTGLRVHDANRPYGQHNLVEWAKPSLSHRAKLTRIMDSQLKEQYPLEDAIQAAKLTLKCLGSNTRNRPSMTEVVEALERIQANSKIASEKQSI